VTVRRTLLRDCESKNVVFRSAKSLHWRLKDRDFAERNTTLNTLAGTGGPFRELRRIDVPPAENDHDISFSVQVDSAAQQSRDGDCARRLAPQPVVSIDPRHRPARLLVVYRYRFTNELLQDRPIVLADIIRKQSITNAGWAIDSHSAFFRERLTEIIGARRLDPNDPSLRKTVSDRQRVSRHQPAAADGTNEVGDLAIASSQFLNNFQAADAVARDHVAVVVRRRLHCVFDLGDFTR